MQVAFLQSSTKSTHVEPERLVALILHFFTEFDSFAGQLHHTKNIVS